MIYKRQAIWQDIQAEDPKLRNPYLLIKLKGREWSFQGAWANQGNLWIQKLYNGFEIQPFSYKNVQKA